MSSCPVPASFAKILSWSLAAEKQLRRSKQVAADFGISEATLQHLLKRAEIDEGKRPGQTADDTVEARLPDLAVHPDIAGFDDLAHALDLKGSLIAARATLESALARRETRGAHNRSDYPELDPALKVNMVWSLTGGLTQEPVAETPADIARLITATEDSVVGKLVE